MPGPRDIDSAVPAFAALPATRITLGEGREWAAVHLVGRLATHRVPVICVAGYTRNMTDYAQFVPLMLLRTQLTDQLPEAVLEEMMRRRPDAVSLEIGGQGSPALLDHAEEVGAIADFVRRVARVGERAAKRA